jgi:dienelactone hydrolase
MRGTGRAGMALVISLLALSLSAQAQPAAPGTVRVVWETLDLPVSIDGKVYRLDGLMARLDDRRPHPLAVINHGSPVDPDGRPKVRPGQTQDQMLEFVRRGWTTVSFTRRGYGKSEGGWAETYGRRDSPDYTAAGRAGAADIAAVMAALRTDPRIDGTKVISVGVSAGGFATVALTANPPPGLVAAISFAGGRGSSEAGDPLSPRNLAAAFAEYGRTSRIPMLWVYAENDRFFPPPLARQFIAAFNGAGGQAAFIAADAFGEDGHRLFSRDGIPQWTPPVDRFLAAQHLTLVPGPIDLVGPAVAPPAGLEAKGRAEFARYLISAPHKALATFKNHLGFAAGREDAGTAKAAALETCHKFAGTDCTIVNADDAPAHAN